MIPQNIRVSIVRCVRVCVQNAYRSNGAANEVPACEAIECISIEAKNNCAKRNHSESAIAQNIHPHAFESQMAKSMKFNQRFRRWKLAKEKLLSLFLKTIYFSKTDYSMYLHILSSITCAARNYRTQTICIFICYALIAYFHNTFMNFKWK